MEAHQLEGVSLREGNDCEAEISVCQIALVPNLNLNLNKIGQISTRRLFDS